MKDESTYKHWLVSNNITTLHPSGRWRIREADIRLSRALVGRSCNVEYYSKTNPPNEEYTFRSKWFESDEFKHKSNLLGFLKFTFAARRKIEGGSVIAKETAALVRLALVAFADGREANGVQANADAWGNYMLVRDACHRPLIHKGLAKQRQEEVGLPKARKKASTNKSERSKQYHKEWRDCAVNYLQIHPYAEMKKVAEVVLMFAEQGGHKMVNGNTYEFNTIFNAITGVKNRLKNSVSTEK